MLIQDISHVLPVDLYDTTGELDVHLNQEVVNIKSLPLQDMKVEGRGGKQCWYLNTWPHSWIYDIIVNL